MTAAQVLALYRAVFVGLLVLASVQTLVEHPNFHHVWLASAEILAALALLSRRTQLAGSVVLLAVFAVAQTLSALADQWPTQFLQYAATTLFLMLGSGLRHSDAADLTKL